MENAAPQSVWQAADKAVVDGDADFLERLLRDHGKVLKGARPRYASSENGLNVDFSSGDARSIILAEHDFKSWEDFSKFKEGLRDAASLVAKFERAADAIVSGDAGGLRKILAENPRLICARSPRRHRSTLLHYLGSNGIEGFRQIAPKNAVEIADVLFEAGAEVDSLADMYSGRCTTFSLIATSIHPVRTGVLEPLLERFLRAGAKIDGADGGSLVNACHANGRPHAAQFLAKRGAKLDLEGAAGVGRLDLVKTFFNENRSLKSNATEAQLKNGFAWACEYGHTAVVEFLLDQSFDIHAPLKNHGQTGLHWAAYGGHVDTVKLLLARGANVNAKDPTFENTPLGWALYCFPERFPEPSAETYYETVAALIAAGAKCPSDLDEAIRQDPKMMAALRAG